MPGSAQRRPTGGFVCVLAAVPLAFWLPDVLRALRAGSPGAWLLFFLVLLLIGGMLASAVGGGLGRGATRGEVKGRGRRYDEPVNRCGRSRLAGVLRGITTAKEMLALCGGKVGAMLYWLIEHLDLSVLNLLRYIGIRAGGAIATAFFVVIFIGAFIRLMNPNQRSGAPVRLEGVSSQVVSIIGTPAICALTLLSAALVSTVLWANLRNPYVWIPIGAGTGFALIGFHDHLQMTLSHSWLSRHTRLLIQTVIAIGAWIAIFRIGRPLAASLMIGGHPAVFGFISLALGTMVVLGAANAVRSIDARGRFAIAAVMIAAVVLGMIAYLTGHFVLLQLQYVAGARELTVVCAAVTGVCLGFVKAASTPLPMGDSGSLAIGAALGTIAVAVL